ncbi:hypothetical protein Scep_027610 [Stephania cephalantha]|uniref:Uncharacterized protein n=1 Tax=Stephania cephalantha TaxID=152367 RepID=A0AAP0HHE3_9MAGN
MSRLPSVLGRMFSTLATSLACYTQGHDDLDDEERIRVETGEPRAHVQGGNYRRGIRSTSLIRPVHKTLVPPVESSSLESSEEDWEQVVEEEGSTKEENEKENLEEDGEEGESEGNKQEEEQEEEDEEDDDEDEEEDVLEQVVRERANGKGRSSKAKARTLVALKMQVRVAGGRRGSSETKVGFLWDAQT